jgi:hypothetical protein
MKPAWKRLASGKYVDLNNLTEGDLDIHDVETSLNYIIRFDGHWKDQEPLSVAQHSYLCLLLAQEYMPNNYELHLKTFCHDFAETYIGDVGSPVKRAIGEAWSLFADPIEELVENYFVGPTSIELEELVKIIDYSSMDIERRCMWSSQLGKDKWPPALLDTGTLFDKQTFFESVPDYVEVRKIYLELLERYIKNG